MGLLDIIRQKLIDDGVSDSDWPVFIGYTPDDVGQDQVIGLTSSGGSPDQTQAGENTYEQFQVKVRASRRDFAVCDAKWTDVFNSLHSSEDALEASGIALIQAMQTGPLTWYDPNTRPCMSVNFRVVRLKS